MQRQTLPKLLNGQLAGMPVAPETDELIYPRVVVRTLMRLPGETLLVEMKQLGSPLLVPLSNGRVWVPTRA